MAKKNERALFQALENGEHARVVTLINDGVSPDCRNKDQQTPLMLAAAANASSTVELLLGAGANVDAVDDDGWTPLIYAATHGSEECVKLLIDAGADLDFIHPNPDLPSGSSALHMACNRNEIKIGQLLLDAGANPDVRNLAGEGPLSMLEMAQLEFAKELVSRGAKVDNTVRKSLRDKLLGNSKPEPSVDDILAAARSQTKKR